MASLATKRDAAEEDCKFGPYTAPDFGMHLYRSVKLNWKLLLVDLVKIQYTRDGETTRCMNKR